MGLMTSAPARKPLLDGAVEPAADVRRRRPRGAVSVHLLLFAKQALDVTVIGLSGIVLYVLAVASPPTVSQNYAGAIVLAMIVSTLVLNHVGDYEPDLNRLNRLEIGRALGAWSVVGALLLALAFGFKVSDGYSRLWAFEWFVTGGLGLAVIRLALWRIAEHWVRGSRLACRTVIYGSGEQAAGLAHHLNRRADPFLSLCGIIADDGTTPNEPNDIPALGGFDSLIEMIQGGDVDQVILALPQSQPERITEVVDRLSSYAIPVLLGPEPAGMTLKKWEALSVSGYPMLKVADRPLPETGWYIKEVFDRVAAFIILIFLAPLFVIVAIAIKIDSPGPVLFRQRRYGYNNKLIEVLKFRSMYQRETDTDGRCSVTRSDPRVTRVGRLIRRTSIDELPQILTVLTGEMSLVGPRPHARESRAGGVIFEQAVDRYVARHRVKPGITGWAQINGWRGETERIDDLRRRVECDIYYIENWSIWFDFYILVRTPFALLDLRKAY